MKSDPLSDDARLHDLTKDRNDTDEHEQARAQAGVALDEAIHGPGHEDRGRADGRKNVEKTGHKPHEPSVPHPKDKEAD